MKYHLYRSLLDAPSSFSRLRTVTLTGETYPVDKLSGVLPAEAGLSQRTNTLYMGTNVISGTAKAVVVYTGIETEFGKVSERLKLRPPETEFERGLSKFGYFLMEVTLTLVGLIFAANVYLHRPVLESFMFSLALAVGLTPQLLPAIISINLARGAKTMAKKQVIVKRLPAIENFGSMNVFCTDKTGTLRKILVHGNAFNRRSDNNYSLDTCSNPAQISTVAVEFCAGSGGDRDVLRYCRRECETSVLQPRKILVKAQHL